MAKTHWDKFFWADWDADPAIRISSLAAQGLWMRMLCLAGQAGGYVKISGSPVRPEQLARLVAEPVELVTELLTELETNGVFSRDRHGAIYCRRMIRDVKKAKTARENGKKGGNPTLSNEREISPSDNPPVEDSTYHKPVSKKEETPSGVSKKDSDALAIPSFLKRDGPQPEHVDQPTQQNPKTEPVCQPPAEQASEPKARAKTTRRTGLPAGWAPNGTIPTQQWKTACDQGAVEDDIRDHWGEFCNSAEAHGRLYANWPAAWRTWLGNIERFSGNGRSRDNDQQRTDSGRRALLDSVGLGVADSGPGAKPPGTVH